MNTTAILTTIYFLTGAIFNLEGVYTLNINKKSSANRLFFIVMLNLSIWAWAYKSMITAPSAMIAVYYWRFSVLTWGTFYSIFYHFIDVLQKGEYKRSLRFYLLVYLPSLLNIIIYCLLGDNTMLTTKLIKASYGWSTANLLGAISPYFLFYYFTFFVAAFIKTRQWALNSKNPRYKRKLRKIVSLFTIVFLVGLFTDIKFSNSVDLPSIGIILLLVPFSIIFDSIRKRKILAESIDVNNSLIINNHLMHKIILLNGYCYMIASFTAFAIDYYFLKKGMKAALIIAVSLYILGAIHFMLVNKLKSTNLQYAFITFSGTLLIIILRIYYNQVGGATTWPVVFYLLILTVVFDQKIYSYLAYGIIITVQLIAWYIRPSYQLHVGPINQVTAIVIVIVCIILIQFINKTFRRRVNQNSRYMKKQTFLTDASHRLLTSTLTNENEKINELLFDSLSPFDAEKAYLLMLKKEKEKIHVSNQATTTGKKEIDKPSDTVANELYQLIINYLTDNHTIYVDEVEKIPDYAINLKLFLHEKGIKHFILAPLMIDNVLSGALVHIYPAPLENETDIQYVTVIANFIGEFKRKLIYEKSLYQSANFDLITGLPNRNNFKNIIHEKINDPYTQILSIIFIDIDNFKDINDAFGHHIGDEVLKLMAEILTDITGDEGAVSRFGGDEFIIVHDYIANRQEAKYFVEQIYQVFKEPIEIEQYDFRISISAGIAFYPEDGSTINELIKNADLAMYAARQHGKNRYDFCSEDAKKQSVETILYTNKLFDALKNNEFLLYFQPQVSTVDESIVGTEVLLRWNSPNFGLVPPFKFISILEQTGLIIPVGEWIIQETLALQKRFQDEGKKLFRLSVNLSSVQFQDDGLIDTIAKNLIMNQIEPEYLEVEITESLAISDPENSIEKLYKIKALGCPIAIDDFGVEFSSLSRLQKMPIDRLKIDKSFIDGIGKDEKKETITDIIIKLAHSLKLHSIAEGVEYPEQLEFLREHGCEEIQGYYYAKPMPLAEFIEYVENHNK